MVRLTPPSGANPAAELAALRARHAADLDPYSTVERLPTESELAEALDRGGPALLAESAAGTTLGYGIVRGWTEDDGTELRLLDVWAPPGATRTDIEAALFRALETAIRETAIREGPSPRLVLGANARADEPDRLDLLTGLGYRSTFTMVELELAGRTAPVPRPEGVTLRTADSSDAPAVTALLRRIWAGRAYFTSPEPADVRRWLQESGPDLYLIAEDGSGPIGLAAGLADGTGPVVDDLGVVPAARGRGVGAALLSELLDRLARHSEGPVRLHTEAHDPTGALRLYRRAGFREVARHHRLRKP
ncbi:GNAT family N-acetyltransferase [Microlunatus parietis]|uniref:Ribosomal protein S18 acetylase RimI-like enzyme n=1 Tax=Microlunatus parietis TaxID=682979 RepID=A0A7Y9I2I4_9ACTN|nr:GNAT family N-acetyltransferase [Microlunatus parietis]NYE68796.1 ribosomal protein S18 acetylase RimI-like enzyme [Microlunatus parietis]